MATREMPPSFRASRRSHARALPLVNRKKKRDCSQSMFLSHLSAIAEQIHVIVIAFVYLGYKQTSSRL